MVKYEVYSLTMRTEESCVFDMDYWDIFDRYFDHDNANQTLIGSFETETEALDCLNGITDLRPFRFDKSYMNGHKYDLWGDLAYAYRVIYDSNGEIEDMDLVSELKCSFHNKPTKIEKYNVYIESFEIHKKGKHTITEDEICTYLFEECDVRDNTLVARFDHLEDAKAKLADIDVVTYEHDGVFWGEIAYINEESYYNPDGFEDEDDLDDYFQDDYGIYTVKVKEV